MDLLLKVCPYAIVQLLPVIAFSEWPDSPAGYRIPRVRYRAAVRYQAAFGRPAHLPCHRRRSALEALNSVRSWKSQPFVWNALGPSFLKCGRILPSLAPGSLC